MSAGTPDTTARETSAETWTVLRLIRWSAEYLAGKGVESARLDAEHLLAHALDTGRLQLYLQYDRPLTPDELAAFKPLLLRRGKREPLQYVVGRTAFRDLDLCTDPRVLIPRPETEQLVQLVLDECRERPGGTVLDIGTGSGCIALSLAREGTFDRVVATDTSADAIDVARLNAEAASLAVPVDFRVGDLFAPVAGERFDVVVSNPPYVGEDEASELEPEVRDWEPRSALFAGPSGFSVLDRLFGEMGEHIRPGGLLALEVGMSQAEAVAQRIASAGGFDDAEVRRDLAGRRRFVLARRRD